MDFLPARLNPPTDPGHVSPADLSSASCRAFGGDPGEIQLLLGHPSVRMTERYLGTKHGRVHAVDYSDAQAASPAPEWAASNHHHQKGVFERLMDRLRRIASRAEGYATLP